jgi:cytochrome c oxidase subunit IV
MAAHTYEESKGIALKTIIILAVVTVVEVLIALTGKGYLIPGFVPYEDWMMGSFNFGKAVMYISMISMSLYKAMLVIFEFMHMKYEVKGLMRSVLLPTALLIWAIIAFFLEGDYWRKTRVELQEKNIEQVDKSLKPKGEVKKLEETTEDHH